MKQIFAPFFPLSSAWMYSVFAKLPPSATGVQQHHHLLGKVQLARRIEANGATYLDSSRNRIMFISTNRRYNKFGWPCPGVHHHDHFVMDGIWICLGWSDTNLQAPNAATVSTGFPLRRSLSALFELSLFCVSFGFRGIWLFPRASPLDKRQSDYRQPWLSTTLIINDFS